MPAPESTSDARVVIGMTLYNNARHLVEAGTSLLNQSRSDFVLLMLDDGSTDATEPLARELERGDSRVRYFRHQHRQGMVATWREVVELAEREYPDTQYFAWASDHDRWHPTWLAHLVGELDSHPDVVLVYPRSLRIDEGGETLEKPPRRFHTLGLSSLDSRWSHFCRHGTGAGDMVYGLIRMAALRNAGIFRPVLRPDRLLTAELTLQGQISQVHDVLWFRRDSGAGSVSRQRTTLFAESSPGWLWLPPWIQHGFVLLREYGRASAPRRIPAATLIRMVALYQVTYMWRHIRRSETWHRVLRGVDRLHSVKKNVKHAYRQLVFWTLVNGRHAWGLTRRRLRRLGPEIIATMRTVRARIRRASRRGIYDVLVLTHRLGLRGGSKQEP